MKRERLMHGEERKGKMETKGEEEKIDVGKKEIIFSYKRNSFASS